MYFSIVVLVLHLFTFSTAAVTSTTTDTSFLSTGISTPRSSSTHLPQHAQSTHASRKPALVTRTRALSPAHSISRASPPPDPDPVTRRPGRSQANQQPIIITFAVLGGLIASGFLLGFIRCCHNYRRTPKRDRIAEILQRHNLQRELEELERNPRALRRPSLREPAPPYFPRPPSYDDSSFTPSSASPSRPQYADLSTYTPPPTPPVAATRMSMPSSPPAQITETPRIPSG